MKVAEYLVFLVYYPGLVVKADLNSILCIGSIVTGVFFDQSLDNTDVKWNLEEDRPRMSVVFVTALDMFNEYFRWEEDRAELALHGLRMFEYSLKYLDSINLLLKLLIFGFLFSNSV